MKHFEAVKLRTAAAIWQSAVKSRKRLAGLLVRAVPLIVGGQSRSWVKAVHVFADLVIRLRRTQGDRGLAIFLKGNTLILMRVLSGTKLEHPRLAGSAVSVTSQGIPRWIPIQHRRRLLAGDRAVIRFYLGLLSLYRALDFRGRLDLSTVTDPGVAIRQALESSWRIFCKGDFLTWIGEFGIKPISGVSERDSGEMWGNPQSNRGPLIYDRLAPVRKLVFTSGPNTRFSKALSVGNLWIDAIAILSRPHLLSVFECLNVLTGHSELAWLPWWKDAVRALEEWSKITSGKSGCLPKPDVVVRTAPSATRLSSSLPQFEVGKLGVVEEPGKKRIIAMVDSWTQQYLYPLHRFMFDRVLSRIPQDGTFAQAKPIESLLERARERGTDCIWSYDLSAATDRLPVRFQELLLGAFVSDGYASLWKDLIVNRDFVAPREWATTYGVATHVRYSVGQPMGAYSSWAMLAITHHALIQFAAREAGHRAWFTEYAILGDDIVIADGGVAAKYVSLMTEIGVKIGFHKSIISNNRSAEFAKQFYFRGEKVSPLSLLGISVGWLGVTFIPEVISACESRPGVGELSLYQVARFLGVGYKSASAAASRLLVALPRNLRSALILLLRPGAPRGADNLVAWYKTQSAMSGSLAKSGDSDAFFEATWAAVVDGRLAPVLKRFRKIVNKFTLPEQCLGHKHSGPFRKWFKSVVADPILGQARREVDRAGDMLRKAKRARDSSSLQKVLEILEQVECDLAAIPVEVMATRRKEDENPLLRKVVLPLSVKRWMAAGKFIDRKPSGKFKVRKMSKARVDLGEIRLSRV